MASKFKTRLNGYYRSSEIDKLEITTTDESVVVKIYSSSDVLLMEKYYSSDESVVIYDVSSLLEQYMREKQLTLSQFTIVIYSGNKPVDFLFPIVLYCDRDIIGISSNKSFLSENFLTTLETRRIPPDAQIIVPFFADEKEVIEAKIRYTCADSELERFSGEWIHNKGLTALTSDIFNLELSVDEILGEAARATDKNATELSMLSFTVSVGKRQMSFWIDNALWSEDNFCFRNCFNAEDWIYLTSVTTAKTSVERSDTVVNGENRFYDQRVTKQYEVQSGALTHQEAMFIDQLFSSYSVSKIVYLMEGDSESAVEKEILITDSSCEINDSDEKPNTVKFSWRYTGVRPLHKVRQKRNVFTIQFTDEFE